MDDEIERLHAELARMTALYEAAVVASETCSAVLARTRTDLERCATELLAAERLRDSWRGIAEGKDVVIRQLEDKLEAARLTQRTGDA